MNPTTVVIGFPEPAAGVVCWLVVSAEHAPNTSATRNHDMNRGQTRHWRSQRCHLRFRSNEGVPHRH